MVDFQLDLSVDKTDALSVSRSNPSDKVKAKPEEKFEDQFEAQDQIIKSKQDDAKEPDLKKTNNNINDILAMIQACLNAKQNQPDQAQIKLLNQAQSNPDQQVEALDSISDALMTKLDHKIETLTLDISKIDLHEDSAIQQILTNANKLEQLQDIRTALENLNLPVANDSQPLHKEEEILLEARFEEFIAKFESFEYKREEINPQSDEQSGSDESLIDLTHSLEDTEASAFDTNADGASHEELMSQHNMAELQTQALVNDASVNKAEQITTVNIDQLDTYLSEQLIKMPSGTREELKLTLSPDALGSIEMNIVKENNNITIHITVSNHESLDLLESKMDDLKSLLQSRGLESKIELSETAKSDDQANSGAKDQKQDTESQTEQEQKDKLRFLQPEWLKQKMGYESFSNSLDKVL